MKTKLLAAATALAISSGAQAAVLFDNGAPVNGAGLSILTSPNTTYGTGSQTTANNVVADDFSAGAAWTVTSLDFYSYQTGATSFGFTSATWSIISGSINGGTVVASGTTNVTNGGLVGYRVLSTNTTDTTRAIYRVSADVTDFNLAAGNYYLTWSLAGNANLSGPWTPVLPGSEGTGNAYQSAGGAAFSPLADAGSSLSYGLPFTINGTVVTSGVPEPATWAMMIVGFGLVGGAMRRRVNKVAYA